jgi:outer membrane protein OmpA-like peptidoglycan-associated protein
MKLFAQFSFVFRARIFAASFALLCLASLIFAQSDLRRESVAITYPLDESVNVRFRGTTRLPRLRGEASVERSSRRGTRVELSVDNLPRAHELGGPFTTYVVWAISPEGRVDNLGELRRRGGLVGSIFNSRIDVTTPLQTFALIVTAEPHFLVRTPSRMVILENLPPQRPGGASVTTMAVQYVGNASDYLTDVRLPEVPDRDYQRTPVSLLGARQAIAIARAAGAERDASSELREASAQLEQAENAWRLQQDEAEIDVLARRATSLAVRAEEVADTRRAARQQREEIARRDAAVRDAERSTADATQQITELRSALDRSERARELAERDVANRDQQLRDLRTEVARLRDEIETSRAAAEEARVRLARLEGERAAEEARRNAQQQGQEIERANEQRAAQQRETSANLRQSLASYGTVRETARGLVLTLPENLWADPRGTELAPASATTLEPLAALLANATDYQIIIEAHTDNRGQATALQTLTDTRARALADRLIAAGVDSARIQAAGAGATRPLTSNARPAGRSRNRRIEITLVPVSSNNTTATN